MNTVIRRGCACSVERIIPVAYSDEIAMTPITATANWAIDIGPARMLVAAGRR